MKPWVIKYQPKSTEQIQGQNKVVDQIKEFIENFKSQKKKAALLYGPTGTGKTSSIYAIANELDLEVMEVNASDIRNKDAINSIVGSASKQMSLFSKGKIILVDEVDGLSGTKDRGGISAIAALVKDTSFPLVLTAIDPYHKKFSSLRSKTNMIQFNTLSYTSINVILKKICYEEGIDYNPQDLKQLARHAGGDLRAAINDLQSLTIKDNKLTAQDIDQLSDRKKTESMLSALTKIFKTTDLNIAITAFNDVDEDIDKQFLWLDHNLPYEYTNPKDLAEAYDKLSKADVFKGRIRRWQHWRFLVYVNSLLTAGVAVSKDEKYKHYITYKPTDRILKLWQANMKYNKRKEISRKIAEKTHTSTKQTIKNFHYFKTMFKNKKFSMQLTEELELDKDEINYLLK
ncbi:replication factor C large subunit [Nanoarchaeota archaeon]